MPDVSKQPGWYPDPWESAPYRFFDGITWTTQLSDRPAAPEAPEEELAPVDYADRDRHPEPSRVLPWLIGLCALFTLILIVGLLAQPLIQPATSVLPAPTNLHATAVDGQTIALTWLPGGGGPAADGFVIERDGTEVATVPATVTRYTDQAGLTPAGNYRYTVTALSGTLRSPASAWVAAAPLAPSPTGLSVTKTGLTAIALAWKAPKAAAAPDHYQLFRDGAQVDTLPGDTTKATDAHLEPGTTYRYTLAAVWGANTSAPAPEVSADTASPTLAMARLTGTWSIENTMRSSSKNWPDAGSTWQTFWEVTPACDAGSCAVGAVAEAFTGGTDFAIALRRKGATYTGSALAQLSSCNAKAQVDTATITITVTKAATVDDVWVATAFRGTLDVHSPTTTAGGVRCAASVHTIAIRGELGA